MLAHSASRDRSRSVLRVKEKIMRDLAIAHDGAHYFEVMAVLQAVWLPMLVFGLLACSALNILPRLLHSECEMTYMFSWPQYQKLNLSRELERSFPQYSLHLYGEASSRSEPGIDSTSLQLSGLPALFVPGNSGSHKQGPNFLTTRLPLSDACTSSPAARSSASIALQMHRHEFPHLRHFDFFTVNLNEEFSGLFGGVLHRQTRERLERHSKYGLLKFDSPDLFLRAKAGASVLCSSHTIIFNRPMPCAARRYIV